MDLDKLLRRNRLSLMAGDRSMTPSEKRAHAQFAREISEQNRRTREALDPDPFTKPARALPGSVA